MAFAWIASTPLYKLIPLYVLPLRSGLKLTPDQLMFELAWTLLSQRRYTEAAEAFIKLTELNSWSHGTYYFIAAGMTTIIYEFRILELIFQVPTLPSATLIKPKS